MISLGRFCPSSLLMKPSKAINQEIQDFIFMHVSKTAEIFFWDILTHKEYL